MVSGGGVTRERASVPGRGQRDRSNGGSTSRERLLLGARDRLVAAGGGSSSRERGTGPRDVHVAVESGMKEMVEVSPRSPDEQTYHR